MTIEAECVVCGRTVEIGVREEDWVLFNTPNRPKIQEVFPYLTPEEREMFVSGVCPKCWTDMFGDPDEI